MRGQVHGAAVGCCVASCRVVAAAERDEHDRTGCVLGGQPKQWLHLVGVCGGLDMDWGEQVAGSRPLHQPATTYHRCHSGVPKPLHCATAAAHVAQAYGVCCVVVDTPHQG